MPSSSRMKEVRRVLVRWFHRDQDARRSLAFRTSADVRTSVRAGYAVRSSRRQELMALLQRKMRAANH